MWFLSGQVYGLWAERLSRTASSRWRHLDRKVGSAPNHKFGRAFRGKCRFDMASRIGVRASLPESSLRHSSAGGDMCGTMPPAAAD